MTRKAISIYMAATCAMAIVVPGRFAIGIVLAVESIILILFGTLFRSLLMVFKIRELRSIALCSFIVFLVIVFKQLLTFLSPVLSLQLSFIIFLPAISSFTTVFLFDENRYSLKQSLKNNFIPLFIFCIYILAISFLRDILGYGTITFPVYGTMVEILVFPQNYTYAGTFLATIPGALILCAFFLVGFLLIEEKFNIIKKAGIQK